MQIQSKDFQNILNALPALKKIYNTHSLLDYLRTEIKGFQMQNSTFVETDILLETIHESINYLYGNAIANDASDFSSPS